MRRFVENLGVFSIGGTVKAICIVYSFKFTNIIKKIIYYTFSMIDKNYTVISSNIKFSIHSNVINYSF